MYYLFGFTHDGKVYLIIESEKISEILYSKKGLKEGSDPMRDFKRLLVVTDGVER